MKPWSTIRRRIEAITWLRSMILAVQALAPQVEIAVAQPDLLGIFLVAEHRQRQLVAADWTSTLSAWTSIARSAGWD